MLETTVNREYQWVPSDQQLQHACELASQASWIAIDSEFIRQDTFYPQLALIQLYDGVTVWLIDTLRIKNWQPLRLLMSHPQINFILHAAGEDITALQHTLNMVPQRLWDTQVMAAFAGESLSVSYCHLVEHYLQVTLSKQLQRADWLQRPLPVRQLQYAAADVYYLLPLAEQLRERLTATPWRLQAVEEECQRLLQKRLAAVDREQLYRRIKGYHQLAPRSLVCLQQLAAWRFSEAIYRNRPLGRIASDVDLWRIAVRLPRSLTALQSLGLSPALLCRYASILLNVVKQSQQLPVIALPTMCHCLTVQPQYREVVQAIKALVSTLAAQQHLPTALLASQRHIDQLLRWHWGLEQLETLGKTPLLLSGWRESLLRHSLSVILDTYRSR